MYSKELKVILYSLFFTFCLPSVFAQTSVKAKMSPNRAVQEKLKQAYVKLNQIREQAKLPLFKKNQALFLAAQSHALYLARNDLVAHTEFPNTTWFTGTTVADRVGYQGYQYLYVQENLSSGYVTIDDSITNLMAGIYHRFVFLNYLSDEIGIGAASNNQAHLYVYNLGSAKMNQFCQQAEESTSQRRNSTACLANDKVAMADYVKVLYGSFPKNIPDVVLWPSDNAKNISPVFFEEEPDPLPDLHVSGYPISLQFNPVKFRNVELLSLQLYNDTSNRIIEHVRITTSNNDVQDKFTNKQFALFPLERLEWGEKYHVEASFRLDNKLWAKSWSFETKKLPVPMFRLYGNNEHLNIVPGKEYAVYVPPERMHPYIRGLEWQAPNDVTVKIRELDKNTIILKVSGEICREVVFLFNNKKRFLVQLQKNDFFTTNQVEQNCIPKSVQNLSALDVIAQGETLSILPGKNYRVNLPGDADIRHIRWRNPSSMHVYFYQVASHIFLLRAEGRTGQNIYFYLPKGRNFRVMLDALTVEPIK